MLIKNKFVLFSLIGALAFIVDATVLYLLKETLGLYISRLISFCTAVITTWILNRNFTFNGEKSNSLILEFVTYFSVMVGGGIINYMCYALLIFMFPFFSAYPIVAVAIGSCSGLIFNYYFAKKIVY